MATKQRALSPKVIVQAVTDIFAASSLHAKQILSLAYATVGACFAQRAGVAHLGTAMATVRGTEVKYGIKQVDRLLSNGKIDDEVAMTAYVRFVLGARRRVVASLDWTEYAAYGHHRIALSLVTRHGRSTPLVWKTVTDAELTNRRNEHEDTLLELFARVLPDSAEEIIILADRGFGDVARYQQLLERCGFHFIIRFRGVIHVRDAHGVAKPAKDWLRDDGRAHVIRDARVTGQRYHVARVVAVQRARMKDAWFLASSLPWSAQELIAWYGRRFTIEENFRDEKDPRYGLGSGEVELGSAARRDRHVLIVALAVALLTLLGAVGEDLGLDRRLRANTVKRRTHSLFRQGREYVRGAFGKFVDGARRLRDGLMRSVRIQPHVVDVEGTI